MRAQLTAAFLVAVLAQTPTTGIDPALIGTWQLEGTGVLWVVRPDGVYRLHGTGVPSRQVGRMKADGSRWSVKAVQWFDQGTYRLSDPTTWVVTGQMGTGTWRRAWSPADTGTGSRTESPVCQLATPDEVARVLYAPAAGQSDARSGPAGCTFKSLLSSLDEVTISVRQNRGSFYQNERKGHIDRVIDIPGLGDDAYSATDRYGSAISLDFLRGEVWVKMGLLLHPDATVDDLPLLIELARAVARRL